MNEQIERLETQKRAAWDVMEGIIKAAATDGNRNFTAEEDEKYRKAETDLDKAIEDIERLQKHAQRSQELNTPRRDVRLLPGGDLVSQRREERMPSAEEYDHIFWRYVRNGPSDLDREERQVLQAGFRQGEQRAALGTTSGAVGGYLIPQGFADMLVRARLQYGGMFQANTRKFTTDTGNTLPVPMINDTGNAGALLTENTQITELEPSFTTKSLGAYTFTSKLMLVSWQILQDSYFDLPAYLGSLAGERLGRVTNTYLTTGSGSSQPQGIVTGATAGVTGATGHTTDITYSDLIALQHAVDPAYRMGAQWMFHDSTLRNLRQMVDGQNRPLWSPGFTAGSELGATPPLILNYPYVINQDMAVMAANAKSILFGDFSNYWIREVRDVTLVRLDERYADYLQTGFFAFQRLDGALIDAGTHPIVYYANSAT